MTSKETIKTQRLGQITENRLNNRSIIHGGQACDNHSMALTSGNTPDKHHSGREKLLSVHSVISRLSTPNDGKLTHT